MRVIAGTARGCVLNAPKGLSTRPTADRLKENLFNLLTPSIPDARFLDLFSGSGAIGIEALSRGVRTAVLVEHTQTVAVVIQENLRKTRLTQNAEVMCQSVEYAIRQLSQNQRLFDIIFMDPPYAGNDVRDTIMLLERYTLLAENGILVAELPARGKIPESSCFKVNKVKIYGNTQFVFYTIPMEETL